MARKGVIVRRDLDHPGEKIDELGRTLLNRADDLDPQQAERMTKSLDMMQQTYRANQNIPMWPLSVAVLTKFVSSQVVPLLGLTGLGQPMLKVVDALAKLLGQ